MEHATRGRNTQVALRGLRRYLHNNKLKIMLNVYELLFKMVFILIFYYSFGWEMRHLHTEGSCPVVSRQGGLIITRFGPSLGG